MAAYELGQSVLLGTAFTDLAAAPVNPTTVTCMVQKPDGTETTYTTPTIANPATGTYTLVITVDQSGMWTYRWVGQTGAAVAVDEQQLHVLTSVFAA